MRVLAAMSGGVDSSVAAARLVDAGYEVVGVHLALSRTPASPTGPAKGCCTLDDARDARRVADMLGIPFYVWDLSAAFAEQVIEDFVAEYRQGRTPNPCVRCNERIKFAAVLDRARALGFDAVATGHYAQIVHGVAELELHRAVDPSKDQSYVLAMLTQEQLRHTLLPLGADLKDDVRVEAERRGLLVARKADSHDICFIPDGDTAGFLRRRLGSQPGDLVDAETGVVLGHHDGSYAFTIGQRRGLNLPRPASDGAPRYVVDVDITTRQVTVGPPDLLDVDRIEGDSPTWTQTPELHGAMSVLVQVRAHGTPVPATVRTVDGTLIAELATPIRGLAQGQTMVLYDGSRVLGSATVRATHRIVPAGIGAR